VLSLCRGLHERGVESWLLTPAESQVGAKARALGLNVRSLTISNDLDPRLFRQAHRIIREIRPDIVHLHSRRGADTWGALAARAAGVPRVILSRRVDDPPGSGFIRRMKYGAGCDHIIAISEGIRQVLVHWGVPPEKVTCVRSALDLAPLLMRESDPAAFREEHGLPADAPLVVTMAQLIPRKGYRVLLDAIPGIVKRVPDALFLFCGKGHDRPALERIVRERGLERHVRFMGFISDIPALLRAADVVAHPALREGLGIAILEAMGLGKPVVASAVGGIPEAIDAPETGLLVPPNDAPALGDALLQYLRDPDLRRRVGESASERIRREFSVEGMVAGNLRVYRSLLAA
jgi:glycosyltransferase involved in cell wall biosynthesis